MGAFAASPQSPYIRAVIRTRAELAAVEIPNPQGAGYHFITSIEDELKGMHGGMVSEASTDIAARCLANKTHRLSTEAEGQAFLKASEERAMQYRIIEEKKKNTSILQLSPELATQLGMAAAADTKKKGAN